MPDSGTFTEAIILDFSIEQMPTIVLGQDEVDCFAAWVSAEAGLPEQKDIGSDIKVCLLRNRYSHSSVALTIKLPFADKLRQPVIASPVGTLDANAHTFNG